MRSALGGADLLLQAHCEHALWSHPRRRWACSAQHCAAAHTSAAHAALPYVRLPGVRVTSMVSCCPNALTQMGLRVLTHDGAPLARLSVYALRCSACSAVSRQAGRLFCPRCGNMTMERVEVTVAADGAELFGVRRRHVLRGTRYSLPKPKARRRPVQLLFARQAEHGTAAAWGCRSVQQGAHVRWPKAHSWSDCVAALLPCHSTLRRLPCRLLAARVCCSTDMCARHSSGTGARTVDALVAAATSLYRVMRAMQGGRSKGPLLREDMAPRQVRRRARKADASVDAFAPEFNMGTWHGVAGAGKVRAAVVPLPVTAREWLASEMRLLQVLAWRAAARAKLRLCAAVPAHAGASSCAAHFAACRAMLLICIAPVSGANSSGASVLDLHMLPGPTTVAC